METEVCASGPKKRKLASSPAPVATDASHSIPVAPAMEIPGEQGSTDRISQLPDAILSDTGGPMQGASRIAKLTLGPPKIFFVGPPLSATSSPSSLPSKAPAPRSSPPGGATSGAPLLSTSTPAACPPLASTWILDSVLLRILAAHPGPGRHLFIRADHQCSEATVEAWLRSPALDNLQELHFRYDPEYQPFKINWQPPPPSTFRFSPTLRVASIGRCRITETTARALRFPQLKQLALQRVCIWEHSLHNLIASCPVLECLLIHYSMGFSCLRINSLSLRSIGVLVGWRWSEEPHFKELVIENAPRLERLLRFNLLDGLYVSVISAPKLDNLGSLSSADYHYSTVIQGLRVDSLMSVVHTLKVLALGMSPLDLDKLYLLAKQPSSTISTFQGYEINGNTFYTFAQDKKSTNQNSGVRFDAADDNGKKVTYYGYIEEIWELEYGPNFKVPLFRCKWFNLKDGVQVDPQYGMTTVDLKNLGLISANLIILSHGFHRISNPREAEALCASNYPCPPGYRVPTGWLLSVGGVVPPVPLGVAREMAITNHYYFELTPEQRRNPQWHPDYSPTWESFFINRRERALARHEEGGPPPSNFNEAGRRPWWRGRTLQGVMAYRGPRLRYPQSQPTRAPRGSTTATPMCDDDDGDYDDYSGEYYRARHEYD
ncbi:hypothetical protein QYE76_011834 [Lolium multiflorum]|uniref:F-box/LRR-repeat protein 15/At3g58940/PEG3-like LRR domain-containing protein n=1 Tax=Lolium multiflorum TaxID=4521 RepID=A0AAD8TY32_LOLMU|nr:hypothetical protein QYE76_011834 [Lolium multiflorum]